MISLKIFLSSYLALIILNWPFVSKVISLPPGLTHILLILTALILILIKRNVSFKIDKKIAVCIFILAAFSIFQYLYSFYINYKFFIGFILSILPILLFLIFKNIDFEQKEIEIALKFILFFITITLIQPFAVGILTLQNIRWEPSLYRELGAMALSGVIAFAISLHFYKETGKLFYVWISVFIATVIFMTVLKKSIIEILFILLIFSWGSKQSQRIIYKLIIPLLLITSPLIYNALNANIVLNIDYLNAVGVDDHVRIGMYNAALQIAVDYFPFGSGYGSFGSLASIIGEYSKIHEIYGVSSIGSNSEANVNDGAHTLLDTFWPHLIAETGFLISLIYFFIYYRMSTLIKNKYSLLLKSIGFACIFDSFFLYTLELPLSIFYFSMIGGIISNNDRKIKNESDLG